MEETKKQLFRSDCYDFIKKYINKNNLNKFCKYINNQNIIKFIRNYRKIASGAFFDNFE